ncbi:MAG: hypothetical protein AAGA77_17750 [Bacteroidota bacterium]
MKKTSIFFVWAILLLLSCENKPAIEGLWVVKSVKLGEEEMTPNARWTRLNSDFTHETGNGRFQHSYGTWKLNPESNEISIQNTNGLDDLDEPFTVSIGKNEMSWKRMEEGQAIEVNLVRSSKLPETHGDKVLGLWGLERAIGEGDYFEESNSEKSKDYIFFKWDRRFVIQSERGRINGVYNVHGHKPEVELIPYGDQFDRDFWRIKFEYNHITLTRLNSDSTVTRKFKRIHNFPN